jgi:hypothetical protein
MASRSSSIHRSFPDWKDLIETDPCLLHRTHRPLNAVLPDSSRWVLPLAKNLDASASSPIDQPIFSCSGNRCPEKSASRNYVFLVKDAPGKKVATFFN